MALKNYRRMQHVFDCNESDNRMNRSNSRNLRVKISSLVGVGGVHNRTTHQC